MAFCRRKIQLSASLLFLKRSVLSGWHTQSFLIGLEMETLCGRKFALGNVNDKMKPIFTSSSSSPSARCCRVRESIYAGSSEEGRIY